MQLNIETLTADAFAPFGTILQQPGHATTASGAGWRWWGEVARLRGGDRPYALGYLSLEPADLRFDWAERHMASDELLIPLDGDCLVYVGPPDHPETPARLPSLDRFRVFRVPQGQAVLLDTGVWHGAPLADSGPANLLVILLANTGVEDTALVRFEDTPIDIVR